MIFIRVIPSGITIHTPEGIRKTGKRVRVGDKRLPFFKVGKELKAKVNGR